MSDSTQLLDTLAALASGSVEDLPEVVLVHERIGPVPALELIREVALRFPAIGVVLLTGDAGPALYSAAMDSGARGIAALPLSYDELAARTQSAAQWAAGCAATSGRRRRARRHARRQARGRQRRQGRVGTTVTAVQLALAARAAGRRVALVDLDLQSGDVASYLDVQFRRSIADLAQISDITRGCSRRRCSPTPPGSGCCWRPARASAARRSPTGPPGTSSARCAPASSWSSSTAARR
ncbi:hypothetical protein NKH77_33485 [Streptomyces sp. M19]